MLDNHTAECNALFGGALFMSEDDAELATEIANRPKETGDGMMLAMRAANRLTEQNYTELIGAEELLVACRRQFPDEKLDDVEVVFEHGGFAVALASLGWAFPVDLWAFLGDVWRMSYGGTNIKGQSYSQI